MSKNKIKSKKEKARRLKTQVSLIYFVLFWKLIDLIIAKGKNIIFSTNLEMWLVFKKNYNLNDL